MKILRIYREFPEEILVHHSWGEGIQIEFKDGDCFITNLSENFRAVILNIEKKRDDEYVEIYKGYLWNWGCNGYFEIYQ